MIRRNIVLLFISLIACTQSKQTDYYESGEIKSEVPLSKVGKWEGEYKEYFIDGKLKTLVEYQDGIENGVYKEFSKSGYMKVYGKMKNGDFLKSEGLDSLGNVLERRFYKDGSIYYVEKFDKSGYLKDNFILPILDFDSDTVLVGEEHCLLVKLGAKLNGNVTLTIGHRFDGKMKKMDTVNFTGQDFQYCVKSIFPGTNQIRGFFDHIRSEDDTTTIDKMSFKHTFYVKENPNQKSIKNQETI